MKPRQTTFGISGSTLKLIAILSMLIDHTAATVIRSLLLTAQDPLWQQRLRLVYSVSRDIGRLAFPIFCFLLVEGFLHTRNPRKYAGRLFLFALISEIPFDLALQSGWWDPGKQNVYFTLLIGLLVLMGLSFFREKPWLFLPLTAAGMAFAWWIDCDYNYKGVFLIVVLYVLRHTRLYQCVGGAAAVAWELPAPLGFLPVYFYNGKRGLSMKYFFYWFYPAHLLILFFLSECVLRYPR